MVAHFHDHSQGSSNVYISAPAAETGDEADQPVNVKNLCKGIERLVPEFRGLRNGDHRGRQVRKAANQVCERKAMGMKPHPLTSMVKNSLA